MVVIDHESIGMNSPAHFVAHLSKNFEEDAAIFIIKKDGLSPVAACHDVIESAWKFDSYLPRHQKMMRYSFKKSIVLS